MRQFTLSLLLIALMALAAQAVPLASFSATSQSRQVVVRWELTSPQPIVRFDVIRNGLAVARVTGDQSGIMFAWTDREVQNERTYAYALIAVFADGSKEALGSVTASPAFDAEVVRDYRLHQNYPNPFNPETTIDLELAQDGPAALTVFDVLGQVVARPFEGNYARGRYSVLFNGRDLPSGVYFYQLQAGSYTDQKKMVLLK